MEGSQSSSNAPPPFLTKTYEMVDDPSTNLVVSWSSSNKSFVVWNPLEFARDLLPNYFKHNNFSSFVRQLNTYGFRKIDPDQWEFANEDFVRGQRHLLKNIHRRKPIHSHSLQHNHAQGALSEAEKQELEDEIERLKREKSILLMDLQQHRNQQQGMDTQMLSLEDRLHTLERRQRQMMVFLTQLVQKPGLLSNLMQQPEGRSKKRRLPKLDFYDEADAEDNSPMTSEMAVGDKSDIISSQALNMESFEKMESSLSSWEIFFRGVSHASGEEMYGAGDILQPYAVALTDVNASSGDSDRNMRPPSPKVHSSSAHSRDIQSSPELTESTSYVESPSLSPIPGQIDVHPKESGIDVNSKPTATEVQSSKEQLNVTSTAATGVNDVFWEQFLTETPGSSDAQEVQSEMRDIDSKRNEGRAWDSGNFWWSRKNVDHLTEQMGQLTPSKRI